MKFSTTTLFAIGAALAAAQNNGIPACAQSCFDTAIATSGCRADDTACQCTTGQSKITASVTTCLLSNSPCSAGDLATVKPAADAICAAAASASSAASAAVSSESASVSSIQASVSSAASMASQSAASVASSAASAAASASSRAASAASAATATGAAAPMKTAMGGLMGLMGAAAVLAI